MLMEIRESASWRIMSIVSFALAAAYQLQAARMSCHFIERSLVKVGSPVANV